MQHYRVEYVPKAPHHDEEIRQKHKLEGKPEADDEHLSQPSTVHSLSNFEDHLSPTQTPKSSETPQKGTFQKAADTIKQKAGELKGKLTEEFGDQPQPEKDLDSECKEHVKEINEEIKHQPHGEEEVVEGQGHAKFQPGSASQKASELKGKLGSQLEGLKQKASEFKGKLTEEFGDQPQPEKDLDQDAKEHVKEINEEIKHQPHGQEEIVEGQGHAQGQSQFKSGSKEIAPSDDLRNVSKDILDKALGKIDEMRGKAGQKGEQMKQEAKNVSSQFSEKVEQKTSESFSQSQEHTHIEAQKGSQPLTKGTKEDILDLAQQITEKVQELKTAGQLSTEQKSEQSFEQKQQQQSQQTVMHEGHEHHHLSAESSSFKPTQETHELVEAVKEGLQEEVPLTEVVEEFEHQHQGQPALDTLKQGAKDVSNKISQKVEDVKSKFSSSESQQKPQDQETFQAQPQPQEKSQPAFDSLKQGVQEASSKLSEKVEDVKSKFSSGESQQKPQDQETFQAQPQEKGQPAFDSLKQGVQEASSKLSEKVEDVKSKFTSSESQQKPQDQETFQAQPQPQEKGQPAFDNLKKGVQEASNKLSEKVEDVKSKFASSESQQESKGQEQAQFESQPEEKGQPVSEQIKEGAQEASQKISEKAQEVKDTLEQKKEEILGSGDQPQAERQPLVDKIMGKIHAVNQSIENVKSAFKIEENPEPSDRQPIIDVIQKNITDLSSKFSHGVEAVKGKSKPAHEPQSQYQQKPYPPEIPHEQTYSLKQKVSGSIDVLSHKLSEGIESVKSKFMGEKGGQFHKVGKEEGFTETVSEYKHEQRIEALGAEQLHSENPFETFDQLQAQELAQRTLAEKVKGGFYEGLENLKSKIGKGPNEEDDQIKEPPSHEGQPFSEALESLEGAGHRVGGKISGNFESLKGKLHRNKQEVQEQASEKLEEAERLDEPVESLKQEGQALKEDLKDKFEAGKEQVQEQVSQKSGEGQSFEQVFESLQGLGHRAGGIPGKISGNFESLKGKFHHSKQEAQEQIESGKEKVQEQASEKLDEGQSIDRPLGAKQRIGEQFQNISGKISQNIESMKDKFRSQKEKEEPEQKAGEFHTVTKEEGIDETVAELKKEQLGEPLLSSNPFQPLGSKDINISQPLSTDQQVGGDLKELTANVPYENLEGQEEESEEVKKSLFQKASSAISDKLNVTKEKVLSAFSHGNKENTALLGLVKNIEEQINSQNENENDENA